MPVRIVQSKQNARLKELRRALTHPGGGPLTGIEGPNLIEEALRAGLPLHCIFAAQGSERLLDTLPLPHEIDVLLLPPALLAQALTTESPQPLAALIRPPQFDWPGLLPGAPSFPRSLRKGRETTDPSENRSGNIQPLLLVLACLQDPGNLGAILRSAEAFGATGIVSLPGTVSPWNPKALRASAGSAFRIPHICSTAGECFAKLRAGKVTIFTTAARHAHSVRCADLTGATALLIGNEGNGVPPALAAQADGALTIPCPGPVESLNAAVAAGVLLYEASRQRASHSPANTKQETHP